MGITAIFVYGTLLSGGPNHHLLAGSEGGGHAEEDVPAAAGVEVELQLVDAGLPQAEEQLPAQFQRQMVFFRTTEAPGTIIVDTPSRYLYLVQGNSRALRYGIGVGRDGFQWSGLVNITRKQEWPDWTPPPEMIQRQPYLPRFMAGGPGNPMGARALYLGTTVYRLHGTNAPETIGSAVSSGCFRLVNPDIIDLYERVPVGTKVVIRQTPVL